MKRNRKHNIFGWLAVATLLLTTACADNADLLQGGSTNGTNVVTFTVQTDMHTGGTRGEADSELHISDGKKVDVLVFGVYERQADGTYKLAKEFGKGSQLNNFPATGTTLPEGLNAIDFSKQKATIQLVITSEKTYKVAFWAQSSQCTAYTIDGDLTKVKVSYGDDNNKYANNDEHRDAFCGVSDDFTAESKVVTQTGNDNKKSGEILLRRPFAQVNVGTVGWDYESTALLETNVFYKESTITLTGLADKYDVLTGKATASTTGGVAATFKNSNIPAFIHLTEDESKWQNTEGKKIYQPFSNEEQLKVKLYNDGNSYPYKSWNPNYLTMSPEELLKEKTETYKYLSMCYVLVPTTTENKGATLNSVEFGFMGYDYDKEDDKFISGTGKDFPIKEGTFTPFKVYNVPVQANWRTNILGSNFFLSSEDIYVWINQDYLGDYNDNAYDDGTLNGNWPHVVDFSDVAVTDLDNLEFFTVDINEKEPYDKSLSNVVFNGKAYTNGLKLNNRNTVSFTTKQEIIVTIVQYAKKGTTPTTIMLDNKKLSSEEAEIPAENDSNNKNICTYTITLPASDKATPHTISGEGVILRVSVIARNPAKTEENNE